MHTVTRTIYQTRRSARQHVKRPPVKPLERRIFNTQSKAHQTAKTQKRAPKQMIALLVAAHNEEVVLGNTLLSAINAGMDRAHIYVVDDNSSDNTGKIAKEILPAENVVKVGRSGKGLALTKGARKFKLTERYRWIHIADADGAFASNYFYIFRRELRSDYAAATGYIRSLPGKRVSEFRVMEYTIGMELHRRFQNMFNVIPVIPGPTSCFRSDVFDKVNFQNGSLTEDFDVTLQLHRQKLGKVQFIPKAVTYTQDPKTTQDFIKQITRWNRGGLQSMANHKIGRKFSAIDAYLSYQIIQNLMFFVIYCLWIPYMTITRHTPAVLATAFVIDVFITYVITFLTALKTRRWDVLSAFPQVYIFRWISLGVFLKAFVEVVILRKYRTRQDGHWKNNATRRYVMSSS